MFILKEDIPVYTSKARYYNKYEMVTTVHGCGECGIVS